MPSGNSVPSVTLTAAAAEDFKYLLPRILDAPAHGGFWWPSHEVVCAGLARADWLAWPEPLVASIKEVFWAAFESAIGQAEGRLIDELICGFAAAGLDVTPFLDRLEREDASKALVKFYECNSHSLIKGRLGNGFWDGQKGQAATVIDWFNAPRVRYIIERYYGLGG